LLNAFQEAEDFFLVLNKQALDIIPVAALVHPVQADAMSHRVHTALPRIVTPATIMSNSRALREWTVQSQQHSKPRPTVLLCVQLQAFALCAIQQVEKVLGWQLQKSTMHGQMDAVLEHKDQVRG
jgi:hypothetical protein